MATRSQRTMAAVLALLFLLSSIATTAYVIWQINSEEPVATGQEEIALESDQPTTGSQGTPLAGFTPRTEPVANYIKRKLCHISIINDLGVEQQHLNKSMNIDGHLLYNIS